VEDVLHVVAREQPDGVLVQFGGQTSLNLAEPLAGAGVRILGTSVRSLDVSEDREKFSALLAALGIDRPEGGAVASPDACDALLARIGLPVVVRPSYVLGGRGMEIADTAERVRAFVAGALARDPAHPVLIDRYVEGVEVEVDAISDGTAVVIPGIMEHVERAGVHSGDSIAFFPAQRLPDEAAAAVLAMTAQLARALDVRGFLNIQFVCDGARVYALEANLRASRTVPFVSKAVGVPLVQIATRVMLGDALADLGFVGVHQLPPPPRVAVKAPVFSMEKLLSAEAAVTPPARFARPSSPPAGASGTAASWSRSPTATRPRPCRCSASGRPRGIASWPPPRPRRRCAGPASARTRLRPTRRPRRGWGGC